MAAADPEGQTAVLSLGDGADIVPRARRFVVDNLHRWAIEGEVRSDAALVASELVTNALRHGPPPLRLAVSVTSDRIRIAVADSSAREPQVVPSPLDSESGRGLALLDAVAESWGSERRTDGKQVWCELRRT